VQTLKKGRRSYDTEKRATGCEHLIVMETEASLTAAQVRASGAGPGRSGNSADKARASNMSLV